MGTWYFFFIFLALFFLVELFSVQIWHKQIKVKPLRSGEVEEGSMVRIQGHFPSPKKSILNFHQEESPLLLYPLHVLLQART